jgi:hypothetical protein
MSISDGADIKSSSSTPTDSSSAKRGGLAHGANSASSSKKHRKRTLNNNDQCTAKNPGTEERKKRLEYMQQEQLKYQQQQVHKQHKSSKQSLDNNNLSWSSVSSTHQLSQNSDTTTTTSLISSLPSSLSKVISSVTTIGKVGQENDTTTIDASSLALNVSSDETTPANQEVVLTTSFVTVYKSWLQQLLCFSSEQADYLTATTIPTTDVNEGQQQGGGQQMISKTEIISIKGTLAASSPWTIVQSLQVVLQQQQQQHTYDKTFLSSDTCQQIVNGLANILQSVISMKWMVMNRNNTKIITSYPQRTEEETKDIDNDDNDRRNDVYLLQLIQIQIWIRMILWNHAQDVGWEIVQRAIALTNNDHVATNNTTDKRKRKKKKRVVIAVSSAREGLIDDIRLLTELVPYVIPISMNLSQWLKYTLTFGFRQRIPDYGTILFDHFEIELIDESSTNSGLNQTSTTTNDNSLILVLPVPNKDDDDNNKQQHNLLNDSPTKQLLAKRHNRQRAYFASLVKEEEGKEMSTNSNTTNDNNVTNTTVSQSTTTSTSTVTKYGSNDDKLLFKTSVSLTATASLARTSNPFLKGSARGNYVGSHLGSKLSNITTLFREVKAVPPPAKKKLIPMKTQMVETKKIIDEKKTQNVAAALSTTGTTTPAAVVQRKRKVVDTTLSPTLTPMKTSRSHHSRGVLPMSTIAETPTHHYQSVIDETPAKSQITARTIRHCRDAIVTETPVPQHNQLQLLRHSIQLQMESPIVAETPLHRLSTRGGGDESGTRNNYKQGLNNSISSTVFPTNLWRSNNNTLKQQQQEQTQNKRLLSSTNLVRRPQQQQQQQQQQQMYSPMRDQRSRRSSSTSNM